jgi:selenide, water dikinase
VRTIPILKDLVLVGGGHSHVEVLRRFTMHTSPGTRITLVSEHATSAYSGMLPGHVAGHYEAEEIHIDLRRLANVAGARFIRARVSDLDPDGQTLKFEDRPPLAYDLLSLNIGGVPNTGPVPGAATHVLPVKPIDGFLERWSEAISADRALNIGVVGGGAAGVEIALALRHRLGVNTRHRLNLFEAGPAILPELNPGARRKIARALGRAGVGINTGRAVRSVHAGGLELEDGTRISLDITVWATGASAPRWLARTGLTRAKNGFLLVDRHLRSTSHPTIFAAGDVAMIDGVDLPKSGVYAVRQGPVLAENLRRTLSGQPTRRYFPQRRFLNLIATGPKHAVASRGVFFASGDWAWRWKDRIDRRFMDRYGDLPAMQDGVLGQKQSAPSDTGSGEAMRCKGCGAKLGPDVLSRSLARLSAASPAVDLSALDDAAVLTPPAGKALLQSVDFFPALVSDPWTFGMIAANHCLSDLHAMGAKPWTALALAQTGPGSEHIKAEDLFQMLAGAARVFEAEGVKLVGGHSLEGDELALGFTVNGLAEPSALSHKAGLRPGDALILSKPVGTGVLFAAEMRGKAKAAWIDAAIDSMLRGSGSAAREMGRHGVTAMTDVTGFGLAGHLGEMLNASKVDAELDPAAIAVLDGVIEMLEAGIESSLAPANRQRVTTLLAEPGRWRDSTVGLLADPQTAGGLLAGMPADRADDYLASLRALGGDARIIGRVVARQSQSASIHLA